MPENEKDEALTKPGPLRAGFDYQDAVAVEAMLDWMESPDSIRTIQLEAEDAGFLDDVCIKFADGRILLKQVKFSVHPDTTDDSWGWNDLLTERPSKKPEKSLPSLMEKWVDSWEQAARGNTLVSVQIISNRRPEQDLSECLQNEQIVWKKINPDIISEINSKLGEERSKKFFAACRFKLAHDALDQKWESQKRRFFRLKGEELGWKSLQEAVRKWATKRDSPQVGGNIDLHHILEEARWAFPKSLNQKFEIPPDFIRPKETFLEGLKNRLQNDSSRCTFLSGPPASGKSTFSSWLFEKLASEGLPVVRHHYFLSLSDRSSHRLKVSTAAESLIADLRSRYHHALGESYSENPTPESLPLYLRSVGEYFLKKNKNLLLILDGLDHVWRELGAIEELRNLADLLLPPPPGVNVLFVSQSVDDDKLPLSVRRNFPREEWLTLPTLEIHQVLEFLAMHEEELPSSFSQNGHAREYRLTEISRALLAKSEGQPLHLRYIWNFLIQNRLPISAEQISQFPPCPEGDIRNYYSELWNAIPNASRTCLMLLSLCDWKWPTEGLIQTLCHAGETLSSAREGYQSIRHLLKSSQIGSEPFHQSLSASVRDRGETKDVSQLLLGAASEWLGTDAPEYWKWAFQWESAAKLGNVSQLIDGPSREWTINSLMQFRPPEDRRRILERASYEAAKTENWSRVVELTTWNEYSDRPERDAVESYHTAFEAAISIQKDSFFLLQHLEQADTVPSEFLPVLANACQCENLHEELRHVLQTSKATGVNQEESAEYQEWNFDTQLCAFLSPELFARWLENSRESLGLKAHIDRLDHVARYLRSYGKLDLFRVLIDHIKGFPEESSTAVSHISRWTTRICLDFGVSPTLATKNNELIDGLGVLIADSQDVVKAPENAVCRMPRLWMLKRYKALDYRGHDLAEEVVDFFWWSMLESTFGDSRKVVESIQEAEMVPWTEILLQRLVGGCDRVSTHLLDNPKLALEEFLVLLEGIEFPELGPDDDDYLTSRSARKGVVDLVFDLVGIVRARDPNFQLSGADAQRLLKLPFSYLDVTIGALGEIRQKWLSEEACNAIEKAVSESFQYCEEYPTRASRAAMTSLILSRNGAHDLVEKWLRIWAENILAHGDHKDMPLVEALDCLALIRAKEDSNAESNLNNLLCLTESVFSVLDYTDGKETRGIPLQFMTGLAEVDPSLLWLRRFHKNLTDSQEYYRASQAFSVFLRHCDLATPANFVVASSISTEEEAEILTKRAEDGDNEAGRALRHYYRAFGKQRSSSQDGTAEQDSPPRQRGSPPISAEQDEPDPCAFPPSRLIEMLEERTNFASVAKSAQFLRRWCATWVDESPSEVLDALLHAKRVSPDLKIGRALFAVAKIAPDIFDRFDALVEWMHDASGWTRYWNDEKEAIEIMDQVVSNFPERVDEFMVVSLGGRKSAGSNRLSLGYLSWYRMIQLLLKTGDLPKAQNVVEAIVLSTRALCEVQDLPTVKWKGQDGIDFGEPWFFSIERIASPDLICRERTASAIGDLLKSENIELEDSLKAWLMQQRISTIAMQGLLPLVKASELGRNWQPTELRSYFEKVTERSVASWIIARSLNAEVAGRLNGWMKSSKPSDGSKSVEAGGRFLEECSYFVPFRFRDLVLSLPEPDQSSFANRWLFEFTRIWGSEPDRKYDPGLSEWRKIDTDGKTHLGSEPLITEACRSGFDQASYWAFNAKILSEKKMLEWCKRSIPVDLELWKIPPRPMPDSWPKINRVESAEFVQVPREIWDTIEEWFSANNPAESDKDWIIAGMKGCLDGGSVRYGINVHAALQMRMEGERPPDEIIARLASGRAQGVWIQSLGESGRLIQCSGYLRRYDIRDCAAQADGWAVLPLTAWVEPQVVPTWQPWRKFQLARSVLNWFSPHSCSVKANEGELQTFLKDELIARWSDWTAGLENWIDFENDLLRSGDRIMLKRSFLDRLLENFGGNWIWAVEITAHVSDQYGHNKEKISFPKVLGGSDLILPNS